MKKFLNFLAFLIFAGLAGILSSGFLMPYLSHTSPFDKISWLKNTGNGTTIINKTEQITVVEETAIESSVAQANPKIVGVIVKNKSGTSKALQNIYGTGFIITSDGWVLTDNALLADKNHEFSVVKDGQVFPAEVVKKDQALGLVLIKISQTNLPVVSFVDFESLRLGQRVLMSGVDASTSTFARFVEVGFIRSLGDKIFGVSIEKEELVASGAPIFNVKGEVVGMTQVGSDNNLKVVGAEAIKQFLDSK
jgi:S1-C subfamily serine protease